jgi:hypothetical protein
VDSLTWAADAAEPAATYIIRPARFRLAADGSEQHAPVEGQFEAADLAMEAHDWAKEQLYLTARRFTRAFERHELDANLSDDLVTIGMAAGLLQEAVDGWSDAYDLLHATGFFEQKPEDTDAADEVAVSA